jgi:hypothetical protein
MRRQPHQPDQKVIPHSSCSAYRFIKRFDGWRLHRYPAAMI